VARPFNRAEVSSCRRSAWQTFGGAEIRRRRDTSALRSVGRSVPQRLHADVPPYQRIDVASCRRFRGLSCQRVEASPCRRSGVSGRHSAEVGRRRGTNVSRPRGIEAPRWRGRFAPSCRRAEAPRYHRAFIDHARARVGQGSGSKRHGLGAGRSQAGRINPVIPFAPRRHRAWQWDRTKGSDQ
jgi:hypothetical protein